ncbi:hypothetical protein C8R45DRAFT_944264 [Mycena sanguinolenta]|nr:hypothetical protein C8R45DRAFT_944264 [Mycena sanguinolenta]
MSVTVTAFEGADCTGSVLWVSNGASPGQCVFFTDGGSGKSMSYSGVPNEILFYKSGGQNDHCTGDASVVDGPGSGCANGPVGQDNRMNILGDLDSQPGTDTPIAHAQNPDSLRPEQLMKRYLYMVFVLRETKDGLKLRLGKCQCRSDHALPEMMRDRIVYARISERGHG